MPPKAKVKKTVKETIKENLCTRGNEKSICGHSGPTVYCMGVIGAAIYFISTATGFWMGVLGVLKALVWPVFLVYGLLKFLGM